jgi:hypothetical protein
MSCSANAIRSAGAREQKFTGAAAGLLNGNLVARELGLADKAEVTGEGAAPSKWRT